VSDDPQKKPLHPFCRKCGWRRGGVDSWDGHACKCKISEPAYQHCTECEGKGLASCGTCDGSGLVGPVSRIV
jgi:hypothetical protein